LAAKGSYPMALILLLIIVTIVSIIAVLVIKTKRYRSKQIDVSVINPININTKSVIDALSQAVQIRTISYEDKKKFDPDQFVAFHQFLKDSFPNLHNKLKQNFINDYSLLYEWKGLDPTLQPVLLMAHQDVVPVEIETENKWAHDAFSGKIADGFIWGRGTLDDKGCLIAIMEAVEKLIKLNFLPRRSVYLAFGHDEEIGGQQGAAQITAFLKKNDIKFAFAIDEGMSIIDKDLSPARKKTALIGLSEKGYITLKISANAKSGHSSMPHTKTAIGSLARAISKLEEHQMPINLAGPAIKMFDFIGPEMPIIRKILFANLWAFKSIVTMQLKKTNNANALIRTTCAPTIIKGGVKENIMPSQAHVFVNFRILPGDSISSVVAHTRNVINDPAITINIHSGAFDAEPSPMANMDSFGFKTIRRTIHEIFENTIVAPGLAFGATDSRHYTGISENIYRFVPYNLGQADMERIHGVDERIAIEDYVKLIQFYAQLIRNCNSDQ
jgi:carboxypeptidase PM20D1